MANTNTKTTASSNKTSTNSSSSKANISSVPAGSDAATAGAFSDLLSGVNTTMPVMKNEQAAAYAFWTQADQNMTDPVTGEHITPKVSLLDVLNQAIKNKYLQSSDPTNFWNLLKTTDWYKQYQGQGLLAADAYYNNNPQYTHDLNTRTETIKNIALQEGYQLSDTNASKLAEISMYTAFDDQAWSAYQQIDLKKAIASTAAHEPITSGQGFDNKQTLLSYAQSMGVPMSGAMADDAINTINDPTNNLTLQDYKNQYLNLAKSKYSGFSDLLDKGMTMSQIADPYVQQMASTLEIDPNSIDFTKDATIQKALGATMTPGGTTQAMPLWQYEQELRSDPRWQYTNNARDTVTGIAHGILKDFGVVS